MATTSTWVAATTFLAGSLCPAAQVAGSNGFLNALEGSGKTNSSIGGDRQVSSWSDSRTLLAKERRQVRQDTLSQPTTTFPRPASGTTVKEQDTRSRLTTTSLGPAQTAGEHSGPTVKEQDTCTTVKKQDIRSDLPSESRLRDPVEVIKALPPVEERFEGAFLNDVLEKGGEGVVFRAKDIFTREKVALKRIENLAVAANELYVLEKIQEANSLWLCEYKGGFRDSEGKVLYVAMPLYGNSLQAVVEQWDENAKCFPEREILELAQRLTEAVHTCHKLGFVHRDIKPANFVCESLDDVTQIRLLDFGRAVFCMEGLQGLVGGVGYIAPEVRAEACSYDYRVDIFSLGLTIGTLATLTRPFDGRVDFDNCMQRWRYSQEFRKLLEDMTAVNPDDRPSLDLVLKRIGGLLAKLLANEASS